MAKKILLYITCTFYRKGPILVNHFHIQLLNLSTKSFGVTIHIKPHRQYFHMGTIWFSAFYKMKFEILVSFLVWPVLRVQRRTKSYDTRCALKRQPTSESKKLQFLSSLRLVHELYTSLQEKGNSKFNNKSRLVKGNEQMDTRVKCRRIILLILQESPREHIQLLRRS